MFFCVFSVLCLASRVIEEFACFNTVFEIGCQSNEVIVFDTASYGRNDTTVAGHCQVPYKRNCDVDVHFQLNKVCAGKPKCSLAVNTALFGDPCGYEEFLRVSYRCVPVNTIQQTCFGLNGPTFYDHSYIASANYPAKYFMDADCHWKLSVQKRQKISVTILDFELDVKRDRCYDYLEISAGDKVYFKDCGSLGKQVIKVDSSQALIRFHTEHGSLTQRGFLIYFEAQGPGCPDLEDLRHGHAEYFIEEDILYANVSCAETFYFSGTDTDHQLIQCSGSYWNTVLTPCVAITPPTTPVIYLAPTESRNNTSIMDDSGSLIGIALGVVSAILLITLLLVLALYFHKRRRNAERKLDQWRFVINNLQENSANEENHKRATLEGSSINVMPTPPSNIRKGGKRNRKERKKINNRDEIWQERNLLTSPNYDDEDMLDIMALDPRSMDMIKYSMPPAEEDYVRYPYLVRTNSKVGKYSLAHSRDSQLENSGTIWIDCDTRDKPRSKRGLQYKRAKSGQWDPPANKSFIVPSTQQVHPTSGQLVKKYFTQSAPDLINIPNTPIPAPPLGMGDRYYYHPEIYNPVEVTQPKIIRSSTLTGVPANRVQRCGPGSITPTKSNVRC